MSGHCLVQRFVANTDNKTLLTVIPCKAATTIWGIPLILQGFGTVLLSQYIKHCEDKNSQNWLTQFLALRT